MKKRNLLVVTAAACLAGAVLAGCGSDAGEATYTYVDALSSSPSTWNVHTWKETTESIIFGYTEMGLYDFKLGDNNKGYKIVPEMASGYPVDDSSNVTPEEVEKYGMTGATDSEGNVTAGSKWLINLNESAVWEDGTAINADTYIDSMDRFLDPSMANYRASSWYDGDVVLGNAQARYESGRELYTWVGNADSVTPTSEDVFASAFDYGSSKFIKYSLYTLYKNYGVGAGAPEVENLFNDTATWGTSAEPKYVDLSTNSDALQVYATAWTYMLVNAFGSDPATCKVNATLDGNEYDDVNDVYSAIYFGLTQYAAPTEAFENVGIKKVSEYQIALYLQRPCSLFNLEQQLSGNWIVKTDIYDANKSTVGTLTATTYATSLDKYMSYGPYKLTVFTADKEVKVEKNEKWYGYTDGNHEGEYTVTAIDMPVVASADTTLLMFEKGQLDGISLRSQDMKKYGTSPHLMYTPQSYSDKIALNSSFDKLAKNQEGTGTNKTILSNVKFRQALSWALDRTTFVQTQTAGSTPALGVINDMYVADVDSGILYRDTDAGKRVVSDIYGDSEDGFNLAKAKQLITEACEEENASTKTGHYSTGDSVDLKFVVYNEDWRTAIQNHIDDFTDATVGTPLEGKFNVTISITTNNQDEIIAGNAELCMDIWGGAQMNPYGIPDTWIAADNRTCYGYSPDSETIEIDVNGDGTINKDTEIKSNTDWYNALNNGEYSAAKESDYKVRCLILSYLEEYMLSNQYFIAVRARNSVSMDSFRVQEGTDSYQALVGYGGIRSMKLTQSDAQWAETIANGLDYTK